MSYYKNLSDRMIAPVLFGVGEVHIPAKAGCVELDDTVARAINAMVSPDVILEKVEPKITVDNTPLVTNTSETEQTEPEQSVIPEPENLGAGDEELALSAVALDEEEQKLEEATAPQIIVSKSTKGASKGV